VKRKVDLDAIISQPEGLYFDRKSLWEGAPHDKKPRKRATVRDQIAKYVAAFANAEGGILVLGVEDDGDASGHRYPRKVIEEFLAVPRNRLSPPLDPGTAMEHQGHELLVFVVEPAPRAVMVVGDGFPRRVYDQVISESEEAINAIKKRGLTESIEKDLRPDVCFGDLDGDLLLRCHAQTEWAGRGAEDYLVGRQLAVRRGHDLLLRQGAVLLFAQDAATIDHPNAGIRIFRVAGTERLTGAAHNVEEIRPRLEGALPHVIERAYETLSRLIRKSARLHDLFFRETPEYPTFAWQEAIVNAVAHRDYRQRGACVEVWLFEDRLEIVSPGALPDEVTVESLQQRTRTHVSRSPLLTRALYDLAFMREQGEGIPRMIEEMEHSWLPLPVFESEAHRFRVVLRNTPLFDVRDPEWVRHVRALPMHERQKRILVCHRGRSFRSSDYQTLNQVDRDVAYREIKELVDKGLVSPTAERGPAARYVVPEAIEDRAAAPQDPWIRRLVVKMKGQGFLTNTSFRDATGVDRRSALSALAGLVDEDVLVREGERRGTRYLPGHRWDEWSRGLLDSTPDPKAGRSPQT
jgi:ATP-dependent DNA helicase RecG